MKLRKVALVSDKDGNVAHLLMGFWRLVKLHDKEMPHNLYQCFEDAAKLLFPGAQMVMDEFIESVLSISGAEPNPHHGHLVDPLPPVVWNLKTWEDVQFLKKKGYKIVLLPHSPFPEGIDEGDVDFSGFPKDISPRDAMLEIVRWSQGGSGPPSDA